MDEHFLKYRKGPKNEMHLGSLRSGSRQIRDWSATFPRTYLEVEEMCKEVRNTAGDVF